MKRNLVSLGLPGVAGLLLSLTTGHAPAAQLSPERLNVLDQRGYFTPAFKATVRDLVNARQAIEQAKAEEKKLSDQLPDLQKQADDAQAQAAKLRQELTKYDHPEESDFVTLQDLMKKAGATPQEQLVAAQAYVWAYPSSPHATEAQQALQMVQKKIADQIQADKDAEAARVAARAKLVQRALARDLSLAEWRDFLRDMSQEDLLKYLGRPNSVQGNYWNYTGDWTVDPTSGQKVGLEINFNGGRVISVAKASH